METTTVRLHLGCGGRYLDGYLNIDFPPAAHTVQTASVADRHADITELRFPAGSIAEIRLHHVFEHFTRPVACALLACWHAWLQPEGILRLEVPDFARTARRALAPWTGAHAKAVALRHLFGSHEAPWAVHCQGYDRAGLAALLRQFGFRIDRRRRIAYKGTYNIDVSARRSPATRTREDADRDAEAWLAQAMLDQSASEQRLLAVWLADFGRQVDKGWPAS